MNHAHHEAHRPPGRHPSASLNRTAFLATLHCLTGCAIGEVLGMAIGTALGWSNGATIVLAIGLAFAFGYALAMIPLRGAGLSWSGALQTAFAAETISIATMEIVDNAFMLAVPGAMDAGIATLLFWGSLAASLAIAAVAAFPVNRWLISRGWGHALAHARH